MPDKVKLDYTAVGIIYNPISTGDAPNMAAELYEQLKPALLDVSVKLYETKHENHGEEIAYKLAAATQQPLIISVSGDGGYNDVINGVIRAMNEHGTQPICAVRGAGNANDHRRTIKELPLFDAIMTKNVKLLDVLRIEVTPLSGKPTIFYAHSYVGLGLTPEVADELNKQKLNPWLEMKLVIESFAKFEPFTIEVDGEHKEYDNLIFGNINQMAKVATLSPEGRPDDGLFEVIVTPHTNKLQLLATAAKAALTHLEPDKRAKKFEFKTVSPLKMQLDGEVQELLADSKVTVTIEPGKLRTLV